MTALDETTPESHWLHALAPWPKVRFPLDELKPHGHEFTTTSSARKYNDGMCRDCGLRVLHLWLHSRDWVRRRTETVTFVDDRTVRRQVTVDFVTPAYAPTLVVAGLPMDLVPVALLQKKSLVHFDLVDETRASLSLLGLRQQQTLTAAALRGVAESIEHAGRSDQQDELDGKLVDCLVFGDRPLVRCAMQSLTEDENFEHLRRDALFLMTAERFLDSWMMCLLLPRQEVTRRILKFSFDEPLDLHFEKGVQGFCRDADGLEPEAFQLQKAPRGRRTSVGWSRICAGLGLHPVRIRFPIPSSESAQSYHLEVTAPPGALIRAAHALASLPHREDSCQVERTAEEEDRPARQQCAGAALPPPAAQDAADAGPVPAAGPRAGTHAERLDRPRAEGNIPGPAFDQVTGAHPTVDLHLTDVPTGAFSQAQVEMRAQLSGWLFSMTVACWVNSALLIALTLTRLLGGTSAETETAVTLLVVFVSFASTVVAQQDAHPMLGRLLLHAKVLAGVSSLCALGAAALVALTSTLDSWLLVPTLISCVSAGLLTWAAVLSRAPRPDHRDVSPWDFTVPMRSPAAGGRGGRTWCPGPIDERPQDDRTARRKLGLDKPAIEVATAEGVRLRTRWAKGTQAHLTQRLNAALRHLDRQNTGTVGTRFDASKARDSAHATSETLSAGPPETVAPQQDAVMPTTVVTTCAPIATPAQRTPDAIGNGIAGQPE